MKSTIIELSLFFFLFFLLWLLIIICSFCKVWPTTQWVKKAPLCGSHSASGIKGIFFRGGKVTFPDFFPAWNMLFPGKNCSFWLTPNKFQWFQKVTSKNLFPIHFQFPPLPFQIFLLFLSIFPFFLAPLFPVGQQKFSGENVMGALCPVPPCLLCHYAGHTYLIKPRATKQFCTHKKRPPLTLDQKYVNIPIL